MHTNQKKRQLSIFPPTLPPSSSLFSSLAPSLPLSLPSSLPSSLPPSFPPFLPLSFPPFFPPPPPSLPPSRCQEFPCVEWGVASSSWPPSWVWWLAGCRCHSPGGESTGRGVSDRPRLPEGHQRRKLCRVWHKLCHCWGVWVWRCTHSSDSGRLTFLKETARSQERLELRVTNAHQCPNGCSLWNIMNHPKLIGSSNRSFHFRLIEMCIGKIENAGNFRIDGIRNDQRWSFDGTYWDLSSGV